MRIPNIRYPHVTHINLPVLDSNPIHNCGSPLKFMGHSVQAAPFSSVAGYGQLLHLILTPGEAVELTNHHSS
jgi:hypothetical protein